MSNQRVKIHSLFTSQSMPLRAALLLLLFSSTPLLAEDKDMEKGMLEYHHKNYDEAAGDLGTALPTEFSNPVLHYYLANCMVHLRNKEAAIREYRIAYAIQPNGPVGKYSKMCLERFGIDAEGKTSKSAPKDSLKSTGATPQNPTQLELPPSAAEIASLKANPHDGSVSSVEREKSVDNLQDLMKQKPRPAGAPLPQAVGTNLYVRNYKATPAPASAPAAVISTVNTTSTNTTTASGPQASTKAADSKDAKDDGHKRRFGLFWW